MYNNTNLLEIDFADDDFVEYAFNLVKVIVGEDKLDNIYFPRENIKNHCENENEKSIKISNIAQSSQKNARLPVNPKAFEAFKCLFI